MNNEEYEKSLTEYDMDKARKGYIAELEKVAKEMNWDLERILYIPTTDNNINGNEK